LFKAEKNKYVLLQLKISFVRVHLK